VLIPIFRNEAFGKRPLLPNSGVPDRRDLRFASTDSNFNPQNTQCIPACPVGPRGKTGTVPADRTGVVKIIAFLGLEPRLNIKYGFNWAGKIERFSKVSEPDRILVRLGYLVYHWVKIKARNMFVIIKKLTMNKFINIKISTKQMVSNLE